LRVQSQRRHAPDELTTDGYTMLDLTATWDIQVGPATASVLLRATNLLDEEARNAVSFLKDVAPLPGRAVLGGVRVTF
jgi:iron complex outermembrane receptor protein